MTEPRYTSMAWHSKSGNPQTCSLGNSLGAWDHYVDRSHIEHLFERYPFIIVLHLFNGMPQHLFVYRERDKKVEVHELWTLNRYSEVGVTA